MTAASYNPALKSAAAAGDWQVAISAIDVMAKAALTKKEAGPDVVCFNYAMAACAKAGECEVRRGASGGEIPTFWVSCWLCYGSDGPPSHGLFAWAPPFSPQLGGLNGRIAITT